MGDYFLAALITAVIICFVILIITFGVAYPLTSLYIIATLWSLAVFILVLNAIRPKD